MSQGKFIRTALVGLPLGLFILGFASMVVHHRKPDIPQFDEDYSKRMEAARLNRRDLNREDLERYVEILSNDIGERNNQNFDALNRTDIYIQSTLKGSALGYQIKRQMIPVDGIEYHNLSAELTGTKKHNEVIVIGAHYDTNEGSNGLNNNSTGVAAALGLARALAGKPQLRTIRFVFFYNGCAPESERETRGSWHYAKSRSAESEKIVAMLNLDSIGNFNSVEGSQKWPDGLKHNYPTTGNFIAFSANESSRSWLSNLKGSFARSAKEMETLVLPEEMSELSDNDHRSFWNYQFPAILVTDTGGLRNATPPNIDYDKLLSVCQGLETTIRTWANP